MKLYKFTFTATLAAQDYHEPPILESKSMVIKKAFEETFSRSVLFDNCWTEVEPLNETTIS